MTHAGLLARAMPYLEPALKGAGFAVSGGSDSLGMLLLLGPALQARGARVAVVTVDHGLRPEAADEARFVAALCAARGWPHTTLRWHHDGTGNLSAAARKGRYGVMAAWARAQGLDTVVLGHTQDDQAETVLMRLVRGAGVDGLSAMAPLRRDGGVTWLRPLLDVTRAELRALLQAEGQAWCDDPSNTDTDYERVRIRNAMAGLADLGLTPAALAQTAARLRRARGTLQDLARHAEGVSSLHGCVQFARAPFMDLGAETQDRLVSAAVRWVAGQAYPPRGAALARAVDIARGRGRFGLHGALVLSGRAGITIAREARAVRAVAVASDAIWDGRWHAIGEHAPDLQMRMLGEAGLMQISPLPDSPLPRAALATTPALWRGDTLVCAPTAGFGTGWRMETATDFASFLECD